jgi:hypothetical protein
MQLKEFAETMEQNFKNEFKEKEFILHDRNRILKENEILRQRLEESQLKIQQLLTNGPHLF